MAAGLNVVGALISTKVAATVGEGIIDDPVGTHGLVVVFAALIGAIVWNLITWRFGLPSSSTHALIGGLVGAALGSSTTVQWTGLVDKVLVPMVVSPIIGLGARLPLMVVILWVFRTAPAREGELRLPARARSGRPRRWRSATGRRTRRRRWA